MVPTTLPPPIGALDNSGTSNKNSVRTRFSSLSCILAMSSHCALVSSVKELVKKNELYQETSRSFSAFTIISELALEIILLTVITATVTERERLDAPAHSAVTSEVLSSKYAVSKR